MGCNCGKRNISKQPKITKTPPKTKTVNNGTTLKRVIRRVY